MVFVQSLLVELKTWCRATDLLQILPQKYKSPWSRVLDAQLAGKSFFFLLQLKRKKVMLSPGIDATTISYFNEIPYSEALLADLQLIIVFITKGISLEVSRLVNVSLD